MEVDFKIWLIKVRTKLFTMSRNCVCLSYLYCSDIEYDIVKFIASKELKFLS